MILVPRVSSLHLFRKPTFTGLFTNFNSFIPLTYKQNLVSCLIHRIFNLCSSYENFHTSLKLSESYLTRMVFPLTCSTALFAASLTTPLTPRPPVLTASKKIIYFCLPFTGIHSLQIRTQINRLCTAAYPHLDVIFVFRSSRRISSFFPSRIKFPNA